MSDLCSEQRKSRLWRVTTRETVNLVAGPQVECELELTSSASIGASFLDQQVGSEIQRIELRIEVSDEFWIQALCEGGRQVPNCTMRIDLQHIKSPTLAFPNNVDANHGAFGKGLVCALAK